MDAAEGRYERRCVGDSRLVQRLILPGLAFKAAVIGGGYATGRELESVSLCRGGQLGRSGRHHGMLVWSVSAP